MLRRMSLILVTKVKHQKSKSKRTCSNHSTKYIILKREHRWFESSLHKSKISNLSTFNLWITDKIKDYLLDISIYSPRPWCQYQAMFRCGEARHSGHVRDTETCQRNKIISTVTREGTRLTYHCACAVCDWCITQCKCSGCPRIKWGRGRCQCWASRAVWPRTQVRCYSAKY